nr:unnamed protein product [Digitaria exilis]
MVMDGSVVGGWQLVVRALSDEDDVVDERGDGGAEEGAEPVDPMVLPDAADDGRAEGHGGVHGGAVEGAAGEDVGADDEADGDGRDDAEVALVGVHGGGTRPKVMTTSKTTAFQAPTPADSEKAPTASPPVAILRRRQATTEPSSCATQ